MVPVYALGEWAIHVHLLHLRPFRWRGREVELITAKGHRQHHEDPNNLNLIVLGVVESLVLYLVMVPLVVLTGCALIGLRVRGGAAAGRVERGPTRPTS